MRATFLELLGVHPRRIGGVETHTKMLTRRLADCGWNSVICVCQQPSPTVKRYLDAPYLQWEVIPEIYTNRLEVLPTLARLLAQYRPQWLFMQFTPCLSCYPLLARVFGVKKILFADQSSRPEDYQPTKASRWKRLLGRGLTSSYNGIVAVSDYNQQTLEHRGFVPVNRLHRIYNSVDLERVQLGNGPEFRHRYSIPKDRVLVIQTSSLISEKGVGDVLHGARIALEANSNLHFALVGDGAPHSLEQYQFLSRQLGIESHVTFTGLVEDPMGSGVYAAADICCQLSRWQEAFGWVVAEAMASNRPVIGTRVGAIPEIIEDESSGYLISPGDSAAFAQRVLHLADRPELRQSFGAAGRAKAEREFNLETSVQTLIQLFESE